MNFGALLLALGSFYSGAKALESAFDDGRKSSRRRRQLQASPRSGPMQPYEDRPMTVTTHEVRNIEQRLGYILQMIKKGRDNPEVRARTVQILSQKCGTGRNKHWCTPEKDWDAEVRTIFDAVRSQVRYVRDTHNKDLFQHPLRTLQFGGGDCDDYSIVLASMLQSVGYPVRLRVIQTTDSPDWNHIYTLVGLPPQNPTRWVPLDASVDRKAGWEAPNSMVAATRDFQVP